MSMMQAAPAGQSTGSVGALVNFVMPMVLILGIFWILVWRPQQRRMKEHQATIMAVKKGDDVITAGGIRGRVIKVTDEDAEVEIANGVRVRVIKSTLTQVVTNKKPAND
jgi:preprotein translocase subunit YajC